MIESRKSDILKNFVNVLGNQFVYLFSAFFLSIFTIFLYYDIQKIYVNVLLSVYIISIIIYYLVRLYIIIEENGFHSFISKIFSGLINFCLLVSTLLVLIPILLYSYNFISELTGNIYFNLAIFSVLFLGVMLLDMFVILLGSFYLRVFIETRIESHFLVGVVGIKRL